MATVIKCILLLVAVISFGMLGCSQGDFSQVEELEVSEQVITKSVPELKPYLKKSRIVEVIHHVRRDFLEVPGPSGNEKFFKVWLAAPQAKAFFDNEEWGEANSIDLELISSVLPKIYINKSWLSSSEFEEKISSQGFVCTLVYNKEESFFMLRISKL